MTFPPYHRNRAPPKMSYLKILGNQGGKVVVVIEA